MLTVRKRLLKYSVNNRCTCTCAGPSRGARKNFTPPFRRKLRPAHDLCLVPMFRKKRGVLGQHGLHAADTAGGKIQQNQFHVFGAKTAGERCMRYAIVFFLVSGIYFYAFRDRPASPVMTTPAASAMNTPAGSNFLKRPLDRTHGVLDQVRTQRNVDSF